MGVNTGTPGASDGGMWRGCGRARMGLVMAVCGAGGAGSLLGLMVICGEIGLS